MCIDVLTPLSTGAHYTSSLLGLERPRRCNGLSKRRRATPFTKRGLLKEAFFLEMTSDLRASSGVNLVARPFIAKMRGRLVKPGNEML